MWKYATAIVFVLMALVVFFVITRESNVSKSNIEEMCNTINQAVGELNDRIPAHEADAKGLIDFLEGARRARSAAYDRSHQRSDLEAVQSYTSTIEFVKKNVVFNKLTPLNCSEIVS